MVIKPVQTPSGRELFKLRKGQIGLGLAMLGLVLGLIYWSFDSYQTHDRTRETILAEESDSSALVFVQREAFGLVVELEEFQLGQRSAQDLLMARSTLAQRLNVITSTGQSSYEVAGPEFRKALEALDAELSKVQGQRQAPNLAVATEEFLSQTRQLSEKFQALSRTNAQLAIADRALIDFWQGTISLMALSLGLILFLWVIRDLSRGFQRGFEELEQRDRDLAAARADFVAIQSLDSKISAWNQRLEKGESLAHIVQEINKDIQEIAGPKEVTLSEVGELSFRDGVTGAADYADVRVLLQSRLTELIAQIQKQAKADLELRWEQNHDSLTGLLNRRGLTAELSAKVAHRNGHELLVADIDLDGFTAFNSSMGPAAGDALLKEVAERLKSIECKKILLGRISSDEFGVVALTDADSMPKLVSDIFSAVNFETSSFGPSLQVTSCIGWHRAGKEEDISEVAAKTGAALKSAKLRGNPGSAEQFSDERHSHLLTSYLEQVEFREALISGQIVPYLQPIVSLETREVKGYEVLARWNDPERGLIPAAEFIPIATQGGLLDELFETMLEQVCQYWSKNQADQYGKTFSVNLDPKSLQRRDFKDRVLRTLKRYSIAPEALVLEITEQSLMLEENITHLEQLRDRGISIALDDFGTGYSSLSRLSSLPVDILKLDRSFIIDGIAGNSEAMLQSIAEMARQSRLKVTVEGIEDEPTARKLAEIGFDFGQGYLFGKPAAIS